MISNRKARVLVLRALITRELFRSLQKLERVPHTHEGWALVRKFYDDNAEKIKAKFYGKKS